MSEVEFGYKNIRPLVDRKRMARIQELELARDVRALEKEVESLERELEHTKAVVVQAAYENEEINPKNKETRSAGEDAAVARSPQVAVLEEQIDKLWTGRLEQARRDYDLAKVERETLEDTISLTRAVLYEGVRVT
jgi:septal ring factor EnvC (AmiA/AmiB activator)